MFQSLIDVIRVANSESFYVVDSELVETGSIHWQVQNQNPSLNMNGQKLQTETLAFEFSIEASTFIASCSQPRCYWKL